jgi:hypothetical protein
VALIYDSRQLEDKYRKHAKDFGLMAPFNEANAQRYRDLLDAHVTAPSTVHIQGTYRRTIAVIHYLDPTTGRSVLSDLSGNFISAWKLNPDQIKNVLNRGAL